MKKYILALLASVAAFPAAAYDFGTAAVTAALAVGGAALALTFGAPAAIGTIAIGAVVAGIELTASESSTTTGAIEAQLSPSAKLQTPSGWTPPASGQVEPTPPASMAAPSITKWVINSCSNISGCTYGAEDTAEAYAAFRCAAMGLPGVNSGSYTSASLFQYKCGTYGFYSTGKVTGISCPAGYSISGANCVLSDANSVMKPSDGRCTIKRTGNVFAVDPRDPDCESGKIPATVAVSPNTISQRKPDGSSRTVVVNADGSSTVTETRPNTSTNTTESNTTHFSAPDAQGQVKVTGQASGAVPGTGTAAGSTPIPSFDKSGLATETTQQGIKADTGAIKDALTGEGVDNSLAAQKGLLDGAMDGIAAMFGAEASKDSGIQDNFSFSQFLPQSCGCTPLTIDYHGHQASFDWCSPMETIKGALAWALGILTALFVLVQFKVSGGK